MPTQSLSPENLSLLLTPTVVMKFWRKVGCGDPSACWPWNAGVDKNGYGKFQIWQPELHKQVHVRSHRLAYFLSTGEWPPAALHRCDNPPCCNPAHLFAGTQVDNRADCVAKGRQARGNTHGSRAHPRPRGETAYRAKLTDAQIEEIRLRYEHRKGVGALAREFGVTMTTVWAIGTGNYRRLANSRKDNS